MSMALVLVALAVLQWKFCWADFWSYPSWYDREALMSTLGVSDSCFSALNTTVKCDFMNAYRAAEGVDLDYWRQEELVSLCTPICAGSLQSWLSSVQDNCDGEEPIVKGSGISAKTLPMRYISGYDLACVQDSENNWCFYESQSWAGSDYIRWSKDTCYNANVTEIPAECYDPFWTTDETTVEFRDMTNLYHSSLYCSECFLLLMRQRLMSPQLAQGEYTTYHFEQFLNLQQNCSTSLSLTMPSQTLFITSATHTAKKTPVSATCAGQTVSPATHGALWTCDSYSGRYNVSSGTMQHLTNDSLCVVKKDTCLPAPCQTKLIYYATCDEIIESLSTPAMPVTRSMFQQWNPHLDGSCGFLYRQVICISAPGGSYQPPARSIHVPSFAGAYHKAALPPAAIQPGTAANCGLYYVTQSGDTCNTIALRFGMSYQELLSLNSGLNSDCTNIWINYALCVATITTGPPSTDGSCGPNAGNAVCHGTSFGNCCSTEGQCGYGVDYCGSPNCLSGACLVSSDNLSQNGACDESTACPGSGYGECCSVYGYCGIGPSYCGPGNCASGRCDPDIGGPSINGECGPLFAGNKTCRGTQFGSCCSNSGYCGSSDEYCRPSDYCSGACL